jgi:hypothetical protein
MARKLQDKNSAEWLLRMSQQRIKLSSDSDNRNRTYLAMTLERIRTSQKLIANSDKIIKDLWSADSEQDS